MNVFVFMNENKVFALMYRSSPEEMELLTAAFASGVQGMIVPENKDVEAGDIWNGSEFIKTVPAGDLISGEKVALLVGNEVVNVMDLNTDYPFYSKWIDGFSKDHVGFNATGYENVLSGSTWNGEYFTLPQTDN